MKKKIILSKAVKLEKSIFDEKGGMLDFEIPSDCGLVILCGNNGGGYVPYRALLPHQVYLSDLKKTFDEEQFEVIYVIPVRSDEVFPIAFADEYGRKRWDD